MVIPVRALLSLAAAASLAAGGYRDTSIEWDPTTLVLVQRGGIYGRMIRTANQDILCVYERAAKVYTRRSRDEGRTWEEERLAASFAFGVAANPEAIVLEGGTILLAYNERPDDGVHPFTIRVLTSLDDGQSWSEPRLVYEAGADRGTGCWEPAMIQIPWGEVHLFFANEKPYPDTTEQEITMVRSLDGGDTWWPPERISFRRQRRDGMPSPLILAEGKGIVVAIEDNGLSGAFKPVIVHTPLDDNWQSGFVDAESERRWSALEQPLAPAVYGGAPYLRQLPGGETVLSFQSGEGRQRGNTLDFSRMAVYIGSPEARDFTNRSFPFPVPEDSSGLWNALFIKNAETVTAISHTTLDGVRGLWAIDGRVVRKEAQ